MCGALLLLAAGWGIYARVTGYAFVPVDDPGYVYANPMVQRGLTWAGLRWALGTWQGGNWHPLTWLSLMADAEWSGGNPGGYHLTNFLLHALATLELFAWLLLATGRRGPSLGVALLFCIHPAHVESVAWISERKDVLSAVFFFASLLAYTRYAQTKRRGCYLGAVVAFGLGLMCKPMLVTVPLLLCLVDFWPLGRGRTRHDLAPLAWEKLPFALLATAACVVTILAQRASGATHPLTQLPLSWRLAGSIHAYSDYVGELLWPRNLGVFYPYWTILPWLRTVAYALGWSFFLCVAWRLVHRSSYALVGLGWFLLALLPVIGWVQVGSQSMADRYTYLPSVGLFVAVCWGFADGWERWPRWRVAFTTSALAASLAYGVLGYRQVGYWQDGPTLLRHTLLVTRADPAAYDMLGDFYAQMNCWTEAEAAYRREFQLDRSARAVEKLGYLQFKQAHWAQASAWLSQLAARPGYQDATLFEDLGFVLTQLGRSQEAQENLRKSAELRRAPSGL